MDHVSVRKPDFKDILWEGYGAIRQSRASSLKMYQTKLKNGDRSFKWCLFQVYDKEKAQRIVDAIERRLKKKGLNVVKAAVAVTESRSGNIGEIPYGVRIHIAGL